MTANINWELEENFNVDNQLVQYKADNNSSWTTFATVAANITTDTITGLSDNILYDFRIVSNCRYGGPAYSPIQKNINLTCPSIIVTHTGTTISYTFSNLSDYITSYIVRLYDASGTTLITSQTLTISPTLSGTFTGLTTGTTYNVSVQVNSTTYQKNCSNQSVTTTGTVTYYNVEARHTYTRNNCSSGFTGSAVQYIVPANTYSSTVSQTDADNQAQADITANGQTYANTNGACTANAQLATLFVDYYNDGNADLCFYCDTPGVSESLQYVAAGYRLLYPNDGSDPSVCYLAASDRLSQSNPKRRFAVNLNKFITQYPSITSFTFYMRGRSNYSGTASGVYVLKGADQGNITLVTSSTSGQLIPSATNPSSVGITNYTTTMTSGGDGTVGPTIGSYVLKLVYNVAGNSITITTY